MWHISVGLCSKSAKSMRYLVCFLHGEFMRSVGALAAFRGRIGSTQLSKSAAYLADFQPQPGLCITDLNYTIKVKMEKEKGHCTVQAVKARTRTCLHTGICQTCYWQ